MLKKPILLILTFLFFHSSFSQSFRWAKTIKSEGFDEGYDLVADPSGNVYITGQLEYETDFGNGVVLSSNGSHDIFIAKYTSRGNLVWARRAGGVLGDKAQSVALDNRGNVYIAGEITNASDFGSIMMFTTGINNTFVAKYDTSGNVKWVRSIQTTSAYNTRGYGVSCDKNGSVYVAGATQGDTYYNGNLMFTNLNPGTYDGLVAKFDSLGTLQWMKVFGGRDADKANSIVCDDNNGVYVTGYFAGRAKFSPTDSLSGRGRTDVCLVKYDYDGNVIWAKQYGDTAIDKGEDITFNKYNNQVVITGQFISRSRFGNSTILSNGLTDMFVASFDTSGNTMWALGSGGPEDDIGRGVITDAAGRVYVIGDFGGSATFPPYTVTGNGFAEAFITCYDPTGSSLSFVRTIGNTDNDRGRGLGVDSLGCIYACGEYFYGLDLDGNIVAGDSLLDIYICKLIPSNLLTCSTSITKSDVLCFGNCDGSVLATSIGQPPFTYIWNNDTLLNADSLSNLCIGNYTVVSTDDFGCTSTASVTINQPQPIVISSIVTSASCIGCSDGSINITVSGGSPVYTYNWSNFTTMEDLMNVPSGVYSVCVTDIANCSLCDSFTVLGPTVGVGELQLQQNVVIYPNPVSEKSILNIDGDKRDYTVEIFSADGRLVAKDKTTDNTFTIYSSAFSKGFYTINIKEERTGRSKRLPIVID